MLTLEFLDRLDAVCFEGLQKENHLLFKKVNEKRSSKATAIVPFAERVMVRKPGKKITFKLDPEQYKTEEVKEGSEKIEVVSKKISKISTEQSLTKRESEVTSGVGKVQFPSDFKEMIRILKEMR